MYDVIEINEFLFDASEVGEWEGEEELAADNINRIYHHLYQVVDPTTPMVLFREMLEAIWPYWQHQPGLLELDDDLIEHFVTFLIDEFEVEPEE